MKKVWVMYFGNDDVELVKAKLIRDGYIYDKKNKRLIIVTTNPYYYNGKRIYFVFETDIHTFNPKNGKIIEEPIKSFALKLYNKKKLLEVVDKTTSIQIEDLSPHQLTEEVISYLVDNKIIADLLKSLERKDWINNLIWLILGFLAGLVIYPFIGGG